jgi:hypothetical protein
MSQLNSISEGLQNLGRQATAALSLPGQTVEQLGNAVATRLQASTTSVIQDWLDYHPRLSWMFHHPIWSLVIVAFFIFLIWGLLSAIARLTENLWMSLLQSPIRLSQWIIKRSPPLIKQIIGSKGKNDPKQQLLEAMNRLEELRKEQDELLERIKTLVTSQR